MWDELTILWNDLTIDWNDLTMERNDRTCLGIPEKIVNKEQFAAVWMVFH